MKFINLVTTAIMLLAASTATTVFADDAAYNTSNGDTITIGSDPNTGGATQADQEAVQNIQEQTQDLKDRYSGNAQREAVENGTGSASGQ